MASNVTPPDKQRRLLQLIECPVCLNELQDPRMLSCRHNLCYKCVKDYTEKNQYDKKLPCPVCRDVTTLCEGSVDNLPKFFFMNELKEVVMKKDEVNKPTGTFCSLPTCQELAVKFCKQGCDFLCRSCYDEHYVSRFTQSHQVIEVNEAESFTKNNTIPYPPCHRHKHQVMDLYCRTCHIPICTTLKSDVNPWRHPDANTTRRTAKSWFSISDPRLIQQSPSLEKRRVYFSSLCGPHIIYWYNYIVSWLYPTWQRT